MGEFSDFDQACMRRALQLAKQGEGAVEPNPMVGCVIACDQRILSEGWHREFGAAHAEVDALHCWSQSPESHSPESRLPESTTAYVTLEPCCHQGKTPPCTEALLAAGIRRVVVAMIDPNPQVAGQGVAQLRNAGVQVDVGLLEEEAVRLNRPFICLLTKRRPWVIAKWAMSWDGRIATTTGDSRWISSTLSRRVVHQIRGRVDAIAVGSGTVRADDPLLTARPPGSRNAVRIVFDSGAALADDSNLVRTVSESPVVVISGPQADDPSIARLRRAGCEVLQYPGDQSEQVQAALRELGQRQMTNLLVEGGGELLSSFVAAACIDEVHVFLGPKIIGGRTALGPVGGPGIAKLADANELNEVQVELLDGDVYLRGRVK